MGQTLVEKLLSEKMGRPVSAGETVVVDVDFAALHDGSGPPAGSPDEREGISGRPGVRLGSDSVCK